MKTLSHIVILCNLLLLWQSCLSQQQEHATEIINIEEASLTKLESSRFGDLYEAVRIVPLETTPQALFAKVEQTIVTDSMIFVRARFSARISDAGVWQYDANGKFIRQVGACGQGPGEYYRVSHILLRNDTLFAFDDCHRNVNLYDAVSGEHLYSSPKNGFEPMVSINTMLSIPNSSEFVMSSDVTDGPDTYGLAKCNPLTGDFQVLLPSKFKVREMMSYIYAYPTIHRFNEKEALFIQPLDETIYRLEYATGKTSPFVKINTEPNAPTFADGAEYSESLKQAEEQGYENHISSFFASKDYLIVNRFAGSLIWDLRSQKGWQTLNRFHPFDLGFPFIPMLLTEAQPDNTFVCAFDAEDFKDYTHSPSNPLITLANGDQAIDPDGNNVLVIYKLK